MGQVSGGSASCRGIGQHSEEAEGSPSLAAPFLDPLPASLSPSLSPRTGLERGIGSACPSGHPWNTFISIRKDEAA